ncbi:hypothetical protein Zmor_006959 [Zophobas morio]|uniref:Secreted protein n=1 Tax=Zophobas morio TaxID=2755281 RepID=A0AA38IUM1_9CUCU|nr:hypothetical protein Zmor_006959 [Zophobas morio]
MELLGVIILWSCQADTSAAITGEAEASAGAGNGNGKNRKRKPPPVHFVALIIFLASIQRFDRRGGGQTAAASVTAHAGAYKTVQTPKSQRGWTVIPLACFGGLLPDERHQHLLA